MQSKGLSNLKLKIIGLVFVALSGFGTAVVGKGMPDDVASADLTQLTVVVIIEFVSWTVFPIYAWLLCCGFARTASLKMYAMRLAALALVCEVPYDLATSGKVWDPSSQNPVFALLICLGVLYLLSLIKRRGTSTVILSVIVVMAGVLWMLVFSIGTRLGLMPGGVLLLVFVLIFQYLNARENTMMLVGATIGALAGIFPAIGFAVLHYRNGESGMGPVGKWAFYAAYFVCLSVFGLIGLSA